MDTIKYIESLGDSDADLRVLAAILAKHNQPRAAAILRDAVKPVVMQLARRVPRAIVPALQTMPAMVNGDPTPAATQSAPAKSVGAEMVEGLQKFRDSLAEPEWHQWVGCWDSSVARQCTGVGHYVVTPAGKFHYVTQVGVVICEYGDELRDSWFRDNFASLTPSTKTMPEGTEGRRLSDEANAFRAKRQGPNFGKYYVEYNYGSTWKPQTLDVSGLRFEIDPADNYGRPIAYLPSREEAEKAISESTGSQNERHWRIRRVGYDD